LVDPDSAFELPKFPRDCAASGMFRNMVCQVLKMIPGQLDVVVAQEYPVALAASIPLFLWIHTEGVDESNINGSV
jgi:hypothetical protein